MRYQNRIRGQENGVNLWCPKTGAAKSISYKLTPALGTRTDSNGKWTNNE